MNRPTRIAQPQQGEAMLDMTEQPDTNLPAERMPEEQIGGVAIEAAAKPTLPQTGFGNLAEAIANVMAEIKPVDKEGWNDFHKYRYAKMQDLSRELTPLMGKHGIVIFQTELSKSMFDEGNAIAIQYQFTITHKSGEIWPERPVQTGLSACRHRGGFDDKAINKCHTAARKYFLLSLFQIPTSDEEDADAADQSAPQQSVARPRRQVPSPNGKIAPHLVQIIKGEAPGAWAERFITFIKKAESDAEIDQWYGVNLAVFDKLKKHEQGAEVHNLIVDAMDARAAELIKGSDFSEKPSQIAPAQPTGPAEVRQPVQRTAAPAQPQRTAPPKDDPMPDIPQQLRRTPERKTAPAAPKVVAPSVEDVEEFFEFMRKQIEDAPNMEAVEVAWDTYVFPHIDGQGHRDDPKILPPDLDALHDLVDQKKEALQA